MAAIPLQLALHCASSYGVVSTKELAAMGIGVARRDRLVAGGVLVAMHDGVYRLVSVPESLETRCRAVCAGSDQALVTGRAAGRLWGLRRMGVVERVEIRLPHGAQTFSAPWVWQRRCNVLDPVDIVERPDGIRVASPPRLAFDLAAVLPALDLESVIEQLLDRGMCTVPTLMATGRRLYHPRRPGSKRFADVISTRPAGLGPADSHQEVILFAALRDAGVAGMIRQHSLSLPNGVTIHPDIAVPRLRWAIEVDHVDWHGGRFAADADKARDRLAGTVGWQVNRVPDRDIAHHLPATVAELLAIYRALLPRAS